MLIIDERPEERLEKALDLRTNQNGLMRCICLTFSHYREGLLAHRTEIVRHIGEKIPATDKTAYLFPDGDIVVVGTNIKEKQVKELMLSLSDALALDGISAVTHIYELSVNAAPIYHLIEQKREKQRNTQQADEKKRQQEELLQRRERCLLLPQEENLSALIQKRRKEREGLTIMIIEDDVFSCKLVESILKKSHKVVSLSNTESALKTYSEVAPNILFLDINLPNVTGHDLLKKILQMDPSAYIVMFSGNNDKENVMASLRDGAKGFVGKPFNQERLLECVNRYYHQ